MGKNDEENDELDLDKIEEIKELNMQDAEEAEAIASGQRRSLRARKPTLSKGRIRGGSHVFAEDPLGGVVDAYGAEDLDEYDEGLKIKGKRRAARQAAHKDDEGEQSNEERYGLRGRKKRIKAAELKAGVEGQLGDASGRSLYAQ
jgi:hypothetical protein